MFQTGRGTFRIVIVLKLLFPSCGEGRVFFFFFFYEPGHRGNRFCSERCSSRFIYQISPRSNGHGTFFFLPLSSLLSPSPLPSSIVYTPCHTPLFDTVKRGNRELREFLKFCLFAERNIYSDLISRVRAWIFIRLHEIKLRRIESCNF